MRYVYCRGDAHHEDNQAHQFNLIFDNQGYATLTSVHNTEFFRSIYYLPSIYLGPNFSPTGFNQPGTTQPAKYLPLTEDEAKQKGSDWNVNVVIPKWKVIGFENDYRKFFILC